MAGQILKENQETKESAVIVVPPKQAVKEMLDKLKKLKEQKDDLLLPIQDELTDIEDKAKKLTDEIIFTMQEVKETVSTDNARATWKPMPKPREFYDVKALNAINDADIREVLDRCKKMTVQGEAKVKIELF